MTTRNEARSNTQREANTREEEFVFEEPDALAIPMECHYDGYAYL
jgi:hypothetical protein